MAAKTAEGIACTSCGCRHNTVTNTYQITGVFNGRHLTMTKRRRKCRHCELYFTTTEVPDPEEDPKPDTKPIARIEPQEEEQDGSNPFL